MPVIVLTARDRIADRSAASTAAPTTISSSPSTPTSSMRGSRRCSAAASLPRRAAAIRPRSPGSATRGRAFVDGRPLELMPREFEVLGLLLGRAPRLLPKRMADRRARRAQSRPRRQRRRGLRLAPAPQARGIERDDPHAARLRLCPRGRRRRGRRDAGPSTRALAQGRSAAAADAAAARHRRRCGGFGAYTAQQLTARVYDRWLVDAARSVAAQVRFEQGAAALDLPPIAESILLFDDSDRIYFSVEQGGRLIAGSAGIPRAARTKPASPAAPPTIRISTAKRFAVARGDPRPRRRGSGHRAGRGDRPEARALGAGAGRGDVADARAGRRRRPVDRARGARRGRPLQVIASRWNDRSTVSLQPVGDDGVPRELLPFTAALNGLLGRIRGLLARERQFAAVAAHQLRTPLAGLQLGLARAAKAADIAQARAVIGELSAGHRANRAHRAAVARARQHRPGAPRRDELRRLRPRFHRRRYRLGLRGPGAGEERRPRAGRGRRGRSRRWSCPT